MCVRVFVFRQVSAHMHEFAPSSYVCIDPPVTSHCSSFFFSLLVCLFVSDAFTIVVLFPADFN